MSYAAKQTVIASPAFHAVRIRSTVKAIIIGAAIKGINIRAANDHIVPVAAA